jgi:type II secretory pathway pseudopilin PulG
LLKIKRHYQLSLGVKRIKHMNRTIKSIAGVTLLEIMLVLGIAAMIIVMSVRYYTTANNAQQANAVIEQVSAIAAAASGYAQSSGSMTSATSANLGALLPSNWNKTPWGTSITVVPTAGSITITVSSVPGAMCSSINQKVTVNSHFTQSATCTAGTAQVAMIFTYVP